jgi:hypothetical protein
MEDGNLKIVVETRNHTWVIVETLGNGLREWVEIYIFKVASNFNVSHYLWPYKKYWHMTGQQHSPRIGWFLILTFVFWHLLFCFFIWTNLIYVRPVRCARWRTLTQSVGRISQPFRLKLEFTEGKKIPSHAAVDNIRLLSCLTGLPFPSNAPVLVGEGGLYLFLTWSYFSLSCVVYDYPHTVLVISFLGTIFHSLS